MKKEFYSIKRNRIYYRNYDKCLYCGKEWHNPKHSKYCSMSCGCLARRGVKVKENISDEERQHRRNRMMGENNPMWKGGDSDKERRNSAYKNWRVNVFKRDGFKCQKCGYFNGCGEKRRDLNAHHIVHWIDSIELRYEVDNGITLCVPCHIKEHQEKSA